MQPGGGKEANSKEQNSKQAQEAASNNSDESGCSGYSTPKPSAPKQNKALSIKNRKRLRAAHKASPAKKSQMDNDGDDEDSDDSTSRPPKKYCPSPEPAEPTKRLPEELLKNLYKPSGVLLISGLVSWDQVARRDNPGKRVHPNLYTFHKFTDRRYRLIVSGCTAGHSILVAEDGDTYTFGRNTCGQLGLGDTVTRCQPEMIPQLVGKNVIHAAAGKHHTLFVTDRGAVYACGDNKSGQCGLGTNKQQILVPTLIKYSGAPVVKVGCGAEFSMILDCNGVLHSFGMPEYGQLGHNTDGKFFASSTKMSYHFEMVPKQISMFVHKGKDGRSMPVRDVVIVDFSCGINHSVAIDSKKRAFSWGFGGFGRLGHAEPRDECVPRLVKYFDAVGRGVRSVHCGGTYSLAINEHGVLFMFGQTKRTGEANMYPKPVHDLSGWSIKSVGTSNTSIVVAGEDTVIAWGVFPTYGELGLGEINKSSAQPKEVVRMKGLNITQVTMGYSHTLLLCDDSTEEAGKILATLPTFQL